MKVYLIGVGMGNPATLTAQAREAIEESALLLGAPRLLEPYGHKPCEALLLAGDIAARIRREPARSGGGAALRGRGLLQRRGRPAEGADRL